MRSILELRSHKNSQKKISMVTCYDSWSAKILARTDVDCLLVGDSLAMVVHGFDSTIHATPEMMALHTSAVARANNQKLIVSDLPYLAHRKGRRYLMDVAETLMRAGASALKIEAAPGQEDMVHYLSQSGIPMIGHIGLTPQYVHQIGGYKVQGKSDLSKKLIQQQAHDLEAAGCHALVLECVPSALAASISQSVQIPTIGIGAGPSVDGQVLVLQDLLGFNTDFKPRFVRLFAQGEEWLQQAVQEFSSSVHAQSFPSPEESFS
jgi:3-methyl-2-oxobutanoate hydroxymethyltransferase